MQVYRGLERSVCQCHYSVKGKERRKLKTFGQLLNPLYEVFWRLLYMEFVRNATLSRSGSREKRFAVDLRA